MREEILKILIATMLFVSMEGVAESVDEMSFHQTHHAHADDGGEQWYPDADGDDHESDSCEHFCHAHAVALTAQFELAAVPLIGGFIPVRLIRTATCSTAPPTPPPNS